MARTENDMADNKSAIKRLEGRVAQILSARELVINIGSSAGVSSKMKFAILSETPIEVRDPNTQEVLDLIDREKVRVEAVEVRPKVTICRRFLAGLFILIRHSALPSVHPSRFLKRLRRRIHHFPLPYLPKRVT